MHKTLHSFEYTKYIIRYTIIYNIVNYIDNITHIVALYIADNEILITTM